MTYEEAKKLQQGDEVYWEDPAELLYPEDTCSRRVVIQKISVCGEVVSIVEHNGGNFECYPGELSFL